ncbi:MAG: TIGR03943 family protein [Anaerotignum sp.]|nr:TIGR03943 family protein [Anaerotignum sp.]
MKTRSYNMDAAFKAVVLLGYALFFFLTIRSGQVLKYVHPRNVPVIKFAVLAMVLISIFLIHEVFKPQRMKESSIPLLFFAVPLLFAFLMPAQSVSSASIAYEDLSLGGTSKYADKSELNMEYSDESVAYEDNNLEVYSDEENLNTIDSNTMDSATLDSSTVDAAEKKFELIDGTVIVDDDHYVAWMQEIYDNMDKYIGKKIEVTGFVYKDEQFVENEFVSGRMMMVCCAADMQTIGFLCRYNQTAELKADEWIKVYGTIEKGEFDGSDMTTIEVEHIENTEKPEVDYVYPF